MFGWLKELLELRLDYLERKKIYERDNQKDEITIGREKDICQSCETLKMQLAISNQEKGKLLERILEKPAQEEPKGESETKPINRGPMLMSQRKQLLEAESRAQASLIAERKRRDDIDKLEQSIGVNLKENQSNAG